MATRKDAPGVMLMNDESSSLVQKGPWNKEVNSLGFFSRRILNAFDKRETHVMLSEALAYSHQPFVTEKSAEYSPST